jgi:argininosuccinate lyase
VAAIVLDNLSLDEARTRDSAVRGFLNATELADYMVKKGVPFRTAHDTVGRAVLFAVESGRELNDLSPEEFRKFSEDIGGDVLEALSLDRTLDSKSQIGGTSRERVAAALEKARQSLGD